jgi:hypothetical protein
MSRLEEMYALLEGEMSMADFEKSIMKMLKGKKGKSGTIVFPGMPGDGISVHAVGHGAGRKIYIEVYDAGNRRFSQKTQVKSPADAAKVARALS